MVDLAIDNATIVAGSGGTAYVAGAVHNGQIAAIGELETQAARTIDAAEGILEPGFIEPYTHCDAQLFPDPDATPSSWHGEHVFVDGCEIVEHGVATGRRPGNVLRSGRDTRTAALS